jgi:hypothetical protein
MTKLEELKAAYEDACDAAYEDDCDAAWAAYEDACDAAWAAYQAELKKQEETKNEE